MCRAAAWLIYSINGINQHFPKYYTSTGVSARLPQSDQEPG